MKEGSKNMRSARSGFSLIEILIATSILLVIVVLASLVFQQMTGAYQTGGRKMDSQVVLRNVIGAVTRDLALAVDSTEYPELDVNHIVNGPEITFLALTGTPGVGLDGKPNPQVRTAQVISYRFNGVAVTRTAQATTCADGKWEVTGPKISAKLNDADHPLAEFEFVVEGDDLIPNRVYIRAEIDTEDKIASVGAGSRGRNGRFEMDKKESDDIYVGLKP